MPIVFTGYDDSDGKRHFYDGKLCFPIKFGSIDQIEIILREKYIDAEIILAAGKFNNHWVVVFKTEEDTVAFKMAYYHLGDFTEY